MKRLERESGVSRQTLHHVITGGKIGSYLVAKAISDATRGVVTVESLCTAQEKKSA